MARRTSSDDPGLDRTVARARPRGASGETDWEASAFGRFFVLGAVAGSEIPSRDVDGKEDQPVKVKVVTLALGAMLVVSTIGSAFASPAPPTNGGNGAGMSGQCTGPASARPASCKSSK